MVASDETQRPSRSVTETTPSSMGARSVVTIGTTIVLAGLVGAAFFLWSSGETSFGVAKVTGSWLVKGNSSSGSSSTASGTKPIRTRKFSRKRDSPRSMADIEFEEINRNIARSKLTAHREQEIARSMGVEKSLAEKQEDQSGRNRGARQLEIKVNPALVEQAELTWNFTSTRFYPPPAPGKKCRWRNKWQQGCTCYRVVPGGLCGEGNGTKRCSGEMCLDVFRPLPTGFPRRYELTMPPHKPFVPWDPSTSRFPERYRRKPLVRRSDNKNNEGTRMMDNDDEDPTTTTTILTDGGVLAQTNSSLRQRHDGATLHIYCYTVVLMGITNQEFTLAQCLLLAYRLNASKVFMTRLHRGGDANFEEVFDLEYLKERARPYGIEIDVAHPGGESISEDAREGKVKEEEGRQSSTNNEKRNGGSLNYPSCVPNSPRASDSESIMARKNFPACCGLGQDAVIDPDVIEFTAYAIQEYQKFADHGADLLRYVRLDRAVSELANSGSLIKEGGYVPVSKKTGATVVDMRPKWNCVKSSIFVNVYAYKLGSSSGEHRMGEVVPTNDWLIPAKPVRDIVHEAIENIRNPTEGKGFVGGGTRYYSRSTITASTTNKGDLQRRENRDRGEEEEQGDESLISPSGQTKKSPQPPPLPLPEGGDTRDLDRFKQEAMLFKLNHTCEYIGVHLRYESDSAIWGLTYGLKQERYAILRRVDQLAEAFGCPVVFLAHKPLGRNRKIDKIFLNKTFAKFVVAGSGYTDDEAGDMDGDLGHAVPRRHGVLAQMLADRTVVAKASISVIWDEMTAMSTFSQRIYDLRCREKINAVAGKPHLTFSYSLPYDGDLVAEC